jgi:hypothetical protein
MSKIFFLLDSYSDLGFLYENLKSSQECKIVVYNKYLYEHLLKKNNKNIIFIDLYGSGYKKIFVKLRNFFIKLIIKNPKYQITKELLKIEKENNPDLWICDTVDLLSDIAVSGNKCTFLHSVPFKRMFLSENLLKYNYVFLPGNYHLNKIIHFQKKYLESRTKFFVTTSIKIIPYLKKELFIKKNEYFKILKIDPKKKTVVFCPTHDAFFNNSFFPKKFGDQFEILSILSDLVVNKLNCNFIIKLHHYHYKYLDNEILYLLKRKKNLHIFKSNKDFDSVNSKNIFFHSDILITDTSGVGTIGAFLNKKIIFMEPDKMFDWNTADIPKVMRPGSVCKKYKDLEYSLYQYLKNDKIYTKKRLSFVKRIFYKNFNYIDDISNKILSIS